MSVEMPPEAASMPDPGDELIARVAGGTDRASFYWSGRESVRELRRTLSAVDRSLDSFESILDFGCGCGRMLLWMEELGRRHALHGTDVDPDAIAWCQAHLPYARVAVNGHEPPLPYPDDSFDLVYNHSVFTHIDERRQDLWLTELQRVTRPGGLLVLSVHGEIALPDGAWQVRDRLQRDGIAFLDQSMPSDVALPDWYQNTWHAPWYIFEHWGRWFQIRAYLPGAALGYQDHVVLERRSAETDHVPLAARPERPAAGTSARRVVDALAAARTYRASTVPSRHGLLGSVARRAILRLIRPYTKHEDEFDEAVATSIAELSRAAEEHDALLRGPGRGEQAG